MATPVTITTNGRQYEKAKDIQNYALFLGGTNVINEVLQCYDPLITGYGRLFMVRKPVWVAEYLKGTNKMEAFKHILEYGNTAVQGISDITVDSQQIQGGYAGRSFEIPTVATDGTNAFQVTVYEFSGSPVREVIHTWINGTTDLITGLTTYNGLVAPYADTKGQKGLQALQSNQTAEFIYVTTDRTGLIPEYACLFANCFPKGVNTDAFNYTSGQHDMVETQIEFSCTKYESTQITAVAAALLRRFQVLTNSLNFYSGFSVSSQNNVPILNGVDSVIDNYKTGVRYNAKTGKLDTAGNSTNGTQTNIAPMTLEEINSLSGS